MSGKQKQNRGEAGTKQGRIRNKTEVDILKKGE